MASSKQAENRNPQSGPEQSPLTGVVERLAIALARDIAGGIWKLNETLPIEPELAHRFGAGRNAVREAVKILVAKGLLRTERRTGTSVRPESSWNLMDAQLLHWILPASADREALLDELSELRSIIEPTAASLAAIHASALETMRLFEAYDEMEKGRDQTAIDACIKFHELLFEASHNRFLNALAPAFSLLTRSNFEVVTRSGIPVARNLKEHRQIADALSRRDSDAARRTTRKLLEKYRADFSETQKRERRKSKE
jgi:DNA-binding FadR family transcriptional regulator